MTSPTETLGAWAAGLDPAGMATEVVENTKRLTLDALGSALIGWTADEAHRIAAAATRAFGEGTSTVICGRSAAPAAATMVNAYLITARSFCDVHRATLCHVTPVVVPAALTAAERTGANGASLLAGIAAGMEVVVRVGIALRYPEFRRRGWHTPGVAGPLGAAAAVARIEGLSAGGAADALGLAGSQAAGTFASLGSPAIKFHQARAAVAGLVSADLAATGFRAARDILTADDGGILGTYSDGGDPETLTADLGEQWHIGEISTRRWPAAVALQSLISALLERSADPSDVTETEVGLPPDSFAMNADVGWDSPFTAALSARWVAAVVLEDKACWLDQFTPARLAEPDTAARARAVAVHLDEGLEEGGVDLTMTARDGTRVHTRTGADDRSGRAWEATAEKARRAAHGTAAEPRVEAIVAAVGRLDSLDDVRELTSLLGAEPNG